MRDHLVDRAFVADVLLYDRLVLPTLPEQTPENEWPESWNLAKQKTVLRDLGDLAIPIPWNQQRREIWQKRFDDVRAEEHRHARADIVAGDVAVARDPQYKDLPYRITRNLLQDFANADADDKLFKKLRVTRKVRPGSVLEAVSAYPSFDAFALDVPQSDVVEPIEDPQPITPTTVFGWKFFIPSSAEWGRTKTVDC